MLNRLWLLIFTYVTLLAAILLNYRYFHTGFAMFFYLPIFGFIVLYPRWIVSYICCFTYLIIRLPIEYAASGKLSKEFLYHLTITTPVTWFVILTVTYIVIKLNRLVKKMELLSLTDNLTNAFNRRYLELYSEKLLAYSLRYRQPLCLLILDIDHFKTINDTYGHDVGDFVLKKLTNTIQISIRKADVFVRLGGEEFVLLLPNTPLEEGANSAERIRKLVLSTNFEYQGNCISVTVSIGVSMYGGADPVLHSEGGFRPNQTYLAESFSQLYERADQALYQAKANGRNRVAVL